MNNNWWRSNGKKLNEYGSGVDFILKTEIQAEELKIILNKLEDELSEYRGKLNRIEEIITPPIVEEE